MGSTLDTLFSSMRDAFPGFVNAAQALDENEIEEVLPGISSDAIDKLEKRIGLLLPTSHKAFLLRTRGFWLFGGAVQFGQQHPFIHNFPKFEELNPRQLEVVAQRGGGWPPPSNGMLCFGEYFRDADGDQVLFDVSRGLTDGEYPIVYYSHEACPPSVEVVAHSFH